MDQVPRKIAVIDDDKFFRRLFIKVLTSVNPEFTILEFEDGEAFLTAVQAGLGVNLVFLDLNMPRVDGFEVLTELRALEKYRPLPVVVLTVSTAETDRIKSLELGANTFLSKPLGFDELKRAATKECQQWL